MAGRSGTRAAGLVAVLSWMVLLGPVAEAVSEPPGTQLWASTFASGARKAMALSPDGSTLFVSGEGESAANGLDWVTIAYRTSDGSTLWVSRYDGPAHGDDTVGGGQRALGLSPDGDTVFVTGTIGSPDDVDIATVAYAADTGAERWVAHFGSALPDFGESLAVSPTGDAIFVAGRSYTASVDLGYATIAYDPATGEQLWLQRYAPPGRYASSGPSAIAVSPDGARVFVTGSSNVSSVPNVYDYATVAYGAAIGTPLWVRRYDGPAHGNDVATDVVASPDGLRVFVTGSSTGWNGPDFATIAYRTATGARLWLRRYDGKGHGEDAPASMAIGPLGGRLFVTGSSVGIGSGRDFATLAYHAGTGAQLWRRRYEGPGPERPHSIAVYPNGDAVVVVGYTRTWSAGAPIAYTVTYRAEDGHWRWGRRYGDPSQGEVGLGEVLVSWDGTRVYGSGGGNYPSTFGRFRLTIAYAA